jgi:hypothetical protein
MPPFMAPAETDTRRALVNFSLDNATSFSLRATRVQWLALSLRDIA